MVRDELAEALEQRGLWRRAATRWAEVMMKGLSDTAREEAARRWRKCLTQARRPAPGMDTIGSLRRAANETLARMGLERPAGKTFRYYPGEK